MTDPADDAMAKALEVLGEHFDCVQILASQGEPGSTAVQFSGMGSWYGRVGMAREFVMRDKFDVQQRMQRPPDDEENWKDA